MAAVALSVAVAPARRAPCLPVCEASSTAADVYRYCQDSGFSAALYCDIIIFRV